VAADGDLLRDTTLTADPEVAGRYHGVIPDAWRIQYAFGGVSMTAALRALNQHLVDHLERPDLQLVTANAIFCAPVPCGPVVADVTVLRNGKRAAQVACDLRVPGTEGVALRAHGVFGQPHDTELAFVDARFPDDVYLPDECPPEEPRPVDDPWPQVNFHEQTDWRPALKGAVAPWDPDFSAGPARFAAWTRLLVEPRLPDGSYDPLALGVPADSIGPAIGRGLGPPPRHFMTLSLEIGLRFIRAPQTQPAWILQDMQCWQCGDGYATGPTLLWDVEGNLLAVAQQTAHLRSGVPRT
jgi:acyl-CoA thioesterase